MTEYVERKKLEETFDNADPDVCESNFNGYSEWGFGRENVRNVIKSVPAADVAPVVHGHWIHSRYEDCSEQFELVKCSQCSHEAYAIAFYVLNGNYCPNCGAKMDGGDGNAESVD